MRRIVKTHAPQELTQWREENRRSNHSYQALKGTAAHQCLKQKLLDEQGKICAYTGRSIDETSSHIEHLKPQSQCAEWEDVEYRNVVACCPADGGDATLGYGAPAKGGWWDDAHFVSPLSADCERRFRFAWSGHVHPNPAAHHGTQETITVLALDNVALRQLRKSRIDGFFGFGARTSSKPLSVADAKTALTRIDMFDINGRLQEFCFVIKQLLPKYIEPGEGQ